MPSEIVEESEITDLNFLPPPAGFLTHWKIPFTAVRPVRRGEIYHIIQHA